MDSTKTAFLFTGFVLGVLIHSFLNFGWALAGLFFLFAASFLLLFSLERKKFFLLICLLGLGLGGGLLRYEFWETNQNKAMFEKFVDKKITLKAVIVEEPEEKEKYTWLIVRPLSSKNVRFLIYSKPYPQFDYGDEIEISGILKRPKNFNKEFNWVAYLSKNRIYYEIFYPKIKKIGSGKGNFLKSWLFKIKKTYLASLKRTIPEPYSALAGGITVGAKESLSKSLLEKFRQTGIIHIIVLSGYNITIIADSIARIFSFMPKIFSSSLGILGIILFAIMTGASATVIRASIMALLVILAQTTGRLYQAKWALLLAGFLMILFNPKILRFDTGFQLSFLATFALIQISPYIERKLKFIPNHFRLREIASATISTQAFVLPLLLYQTKLFSLVSLPVNFLILPTLPMAMLFSFLTGGIGIINQLIAAPLGWLSYFILYYQIFIVKLFASLPFSYLTVKSFSFIFALFIYLFYACLIFIFISNKNPSTQ